MKFLCVSVCWHFTYINNDNVCLPSLFSIWWEHDVCYDFVWTLIPYIHDGNPSQFGSSAGILFLCIFMSSTNMNMYNWFCYTTTNPTISVFCSFHLVFCSELCSTNSISLVKDEKTLLYLKCLAQRIVCNWMYVNALLNGSHGKEVMDFLGSDISMCVQEQVKRNNWRHQQLAPHPHCWRQHSGCWVLRSSVLMHSEKTIQLLDRTKSCF